jgi:hypothetical protein
VFLFLVRVISIYKSVLCLVLFVYKFGCLPIGFDKTKALIGASYCLLPVSICTRLFSLVVKVDNSSILFCMI